MVCDCNTLNESVLGNTNDDTTVSILTVTHDGASLYAAIGTLDIEEATLKPGFNELDGGFPLAISLGSALSGGLILTDVIVLNDRLPLGDKHSTLDKEESAFELGWNELY